jgi:SAM-dependent methyltransferase
MKKVEYFKMYEQETVHWWYRGLYDLVERYVRRLSSGKPLNILDAGCGTGGLMGILNMYGDVAGIDHSPEAIALCAQRGLTNLGTEDLNTWEPQPSRYDFIVSNDVLSDAGIEAELALVQKFHSALKPKGYLIMNLPAFVCLRRSHDTAVSTQRRYRKKSILPDLEKAGFRSVKAGYRLPLLFVLILLRKSLSRFFGKNAAVTSDLFPIPLFLNEFLYSLHRFENLLFVSGIPFCVGSSFFFICQKSEQNRGSK